MRAIIIHNRNAGTDPVSRQDIEAVVRAAGIEPLYCAHGEEDLAAALASSVDLIIAAGGDGTVADVVSALETTETPIGILPLGGSNNIAHTLGVNGEWRGIPARWSLAHWKRLDRCDADGPWGCKTFVEALGSGVLTEAVEEADDEPRTPEEKQRNGRAAFRQALADAEPFDCSIETGDWRWRGECLMVEIMNIPVVGSRLALAAGATPSDGLLDIVLVTPDQRERLHAWAADPDAERCPIPTRTATTVRLTVHERPFRVDDRSPNENLSGTVVVRVRPSSVRILAPQEI